MAKIIAIGNQKGGTGKTTATCLLANALTAAPFNKKVFVCDCDPQQSIIRRRLSDQLLTSEPAPYKVAYFNSFFEFEKDIKDIDRQNEIVFVDMPGRLDTHRPIQEQETGRFVQYIDTLFVPFVPGNYALQATIEYLKTVTKIAAVKQNATRPLQVFGFVNLFEGGRTADDRALLAEIEALQSVSKIDFISTRLNRYALFRAADTYTSFCDAGATDKAVKNFTSFVNDFNTKL